MKRVRRRERKIEGGRRRLIVRMKVVVRILVIV